MVQEDVEHKSAVLIIKSAKITGRLLAKAMAATLRQIKKSRDAPGRQSMKQLAKGGSLENIPITDENIKAFEPVARKYGLRYKLVRDTSEDPAKWLVFFRARDAGTMTAAFQEFSSKMLKRETERPSVRNTMAKFRDIIKNAVIDRTRHKHREGPER